MTRDQETLRKNEKKNKEVTGASVLPPPPLTVYKTYT